MQVLVVNAGSSSTKLSVVSDENVIRAKADLGPWSKELLPLLKDFVDQASCLGAAGHRLVHGGSLFKDSVIIDATVRSSLAKVAPLAPLHNPPALEVIDALASMRPDLTSVACFDTAFHAKLPPEAATYALPKALVERFSLRRFGFHGLSCSWALRKAQEILEWKPGHGRMVICHLGAGASLTAVHDGDSVDTTMGFTPLEGLVMATRPGDLDPGIITFLLDHGMGPVELADVLEHKSGLAGMCATSRGDMKAVLDRRADNDEEAALAIEVYLHRLRAKIASMAASMSGLDALVFTGGVGEASSVIRAELCAKLAWLGVGLDEHANNDAINRDAEITSLGSRVRSVVVRAREDLVIAAECRRLLGNSGNVEQQI